MKNLDSYDSSEQDNNSQDYFDYALLDSMAVDSPNNLLKPEVSIEPIPSIASSLWKTLQVAVMLFWVPYLFFLFVGMVFALIDWVLNICDSLN